MPDLLSATLPSEVQVTVIHNGRETSYNSTVSLHKTYVQLHIKNALIRIDDQPATFTHGLSQPIPALALTEGAGTINLMVRLIIPSDTHWLDDIIEQQAKHYGLAPAKFKAMMRSATIEQEHQDKS